MGCRKDARLAQSQPPSGKGFRGVDCERQSVGLHRLCAVAHQKISLTLTRSQVSYTTITIKIRTLRVYHNPWATHPLDVSIFRHKDVFQAYYDDQRGWVYEQRDGLLLCRNVYTFLPPRNIASAAC